MTWTIIGTLGGLIVIVLGIQTTWIIHSLGALQDGIRDLRGDLGRVERDLRTEIKTEIGGLRDEMKTEIGGLRGDFARIETRVLGDHADRITRLEERTSLSGPGS